MREIVLDTETTGLSPTAGHRIVDIGCVELDHGVPTGRVFQHYLNPERDMPQEAFQVHGLSAEFLADFPCFQHIVQQFLDFIQDSPLVIHNARFDLNFLNAELQRIKIPPLGNRIIDTLSLAKRKFPGASVNLDTLCRRFAISPDQRTVHGALLDAQLLTKIYPLLKETTTLQWSSSETLTHGRKRIHRPPRVFPLSPEEQHLYEALHQTLLKGH